MHAILTMKTRFAVGFGADILPLCIVFGKALHGFASAMTMLARSAATPMTRSTGNLPCAFANMAVFTHRKWVKGVKTVFLLGFVEGIFAFGCHLL